MTSKIAKQFIAILLFGLSNLATAALPAIDIFHAAGVPDTSGYSTIMGPCYCDETLYSSPIMLLAPGTYDFGEVREDWVPSGYTPDGGPYQSIVWLLFAPMETDGYFPYTLAPLPSYASPSIELCAWNDDACNNSHAQAYQDFDLIYTVQPGENAVQIGLIGTYQYTSALPEPLSLAMFALGLMLVAAMAKRRHARIGGAASGAGT